MKFFAWDNALSMMFFICLFCTNPKLNYGFVPFTDPHCICFCVSASTGKIKFLSKHIASRNRLTEFLFFLRMEKV